MGVSPIPKQAAKQMIRKLNLLTVNQIKAAKPGARLSDGGGLRLEVKEGGGGYWRMKYRMGKTEKLLAFGVYPEVSLMEARAKRDEARAMKRQGTDPAAAKKAAKEAAKRDARGAFAAVAAEWLAFKRKEWADPTYRKAVYVVGEYLTPALRSHSIADLATKDVTRVLERIAERAPDLARKARQYLSSIVEYAIREGLREDGKLLTLRGAVPKTEKGHIPAATTAAEIAPLVKAIAAYNSPVTRAALQLTMLTAMRPGVVASAPWSEFDLDAAEWHVPGVRMKTKHAHIVPLPRQAVELLRGMKELAGPSPYVFPSPARQGTPHVHRDGLSAALRQMGFAGKHSTHGFRGMLRTVGRERLGIDTDVLEAQLAHAKKGDVAKAYDRTKFDDERRVAMQRWADYLEVLGAGGNVVPIQRKAG